MIVGDEARAVDWPSDVSAAQGEKAPKDGAWGPKLVGAREGLLFLSGSPALADPKHLLVSVCELRGLHARKAGE